MVSKLRVEQLETLDGAHTKDVANLLTSGDLEEQNDRTRVVGSVSELESLSLDVGVNVYLTQEGRVGDFVVKAGTPPSDPKKGFYSILANGNYAERVEKFPANLEWFGAVLDGTDNRTELLAADAVVESGLPIVVSSGTFTLSADASLSKRHIIMKGVTESGSGNILNALVERTNPSSGAKSFGVGEANQWGSYYKYGRNAGGALGLTIGGGDPRDGEDGNVLYPDTNSSWSVLQPTKYGNSAELAVQPSSISTTISATAGSGVVSRVGGAPFDTLWEGRRIYLSGGLTYKVSSVADADNMTIVNLNATPASIPNTREYVAQITGVRMQGQCTVSGNTVTRISGDPFVPDTNTEYFLYLAGAKYSVASVTDASTLTLATAPASGDYSYDGWTSVDDLSAAVRVQRVVGAGYEEVLSLAAYASGKFQLHAGSSGVDAYPLFLGNNFDSVGEERKQITLDPDGATKLGGDLGASVSVPYKETAGSQLEIIGNTFNEVYLNTKLGDGNETLYLNPNKHVGFGDYTDAVGSNVSGFIEIKDSQGVIRKLAVID